MKCNRCGQEFGKGNICQHCGADKVAALGEFSGYSTPKKRATKKSQQMIDNQAATPSPQHVEPPISTQICWKCGEIIPLGNFCPVCGQELFRKCPQCGNQYSSQYHICPNCGTNHLEYEKAQAKAIADELERKRKEEEARKRFEREQRESQKRLQKELKIEQAVIELRRDADYAHQLIHQRSWVTDDQRKALLPPFTKFWDKIKSIPKVIDYQTDLSDVKAAWKTLDQNDTFIQLKNEEKRRIQEENKRKAEEEERKRQIDLAVANKEKFVTQSTSKSEVTLIGKIIIWGTSTFILMMIATSQWENETLASTIGNLSPFASIFITIIVVKIRKHILNEREASTEHFYFWRKFTEKTAISLIDGIDASISFEGEVQYVPEKAAILINPGMCFTVKSSSRPIIEIRFSDNDSIALDSNNGIMSDKGTWHGYSSDVRFKANIGIDLAQIDVRFDSPITK